MINEPEPGGFHDGAELGADPYQPGGELHGTAEPRKLEANVESPDSELGRAVGLMNARFGMPGSVVYPGCGDHVIDGLFPGAEVVYVDPSEQGIALIRAAIGNDVRAHVAGAAEMAEREPERFDMLFSLNTHADMADQLRCVRPGGVVFCNNYFGTRDAEEALKEGCVLEAVVLRGEEDDAESLLRTEDVGEYAEFDASLAANHIGCRLKKKADYYVLRKPVAAKE